MARQRAGHPGRGRLDHIAKRIEAEEMSLGTRPLRIVAHFAEVVLPPSTPPPSIALAWELTLYNYLVSFIWSVVVSMKL